MSVALMSVGGALAWLAMYRPTSRFVERSRFDAVTWLLVSASIGGLTGWRFGMGLVATTVVVLGTGLVTLAEIDLRTRRLPREISYPLVALTLMLVVVTSLLEGRSQRFVEALVGVVITTGVLGALHLTSRGGMGDGDVRAAPALGAFGFLGGVQTVWTGLIAAFVAAGVYVVALMCLGRATRSTTIPFGPFLIGGAIVAALITGR